jgi:aspartyl protease family protein
MPDAVGLVIVLLAMALLVANQREEAILGLAPDQFASVAALSALALLVASIVVSEFRGRWIDGVRALFLWSLMIVGLVGLYSYRGELQAVASRVAGELMPARRLLRPVGKWWSRGAWTAPS